ncbi:EF-hand domain-containing protein [Aquabacterium sp.]|uniref:EF-hand domain-containing protein n=1 Tax=Aquabacterium sp. TaxID=1872578 RepID=UPI003783B25C
MNATRLAWLVLLLPATLHAADPPAPRRADPWVPPAARIRSAEPPTSGAALQAQVTDTLRRRFDAADPRGYGAISRAQAERAGLGFVSRHFERIDTQGSGSVSFDELQRYLAKSAAER